MKFDIDPELTFYDYHQQFRSSLSDYPYADFQELAHGGLVAQINKQGPCLAVISGLHGDERSGPLALLEWSKNHDHSLYSDDQQLWLLPLLNDEGWNLKQRKWQDLDLNRAFIQNQNNSPAFLRQVMESWERRLPEMFVDFHEDDSESGEPYVFWYKHESHDMALRLADHLHVKTEAWDDFGYWSGADEIFLRNLGCRYCFTIETPSAWPMQDRIQWNLAVLDWCLDHLKECPSIATE